MADPTRAQKIAGLHGRLLGMAGDFDLLLPALFDEPPAGMVSDEQKMAGRDNEVIVLRISATRLPPEEAAAVIAASRARERGHA
jgi:hypothetical protein